MDILRNLKALRVFEAAARTGGFTRAADELRVSQSAVSKQVAALEAEIGEPLFRRERRRVILTETGRRLAEAVASALNALRGGLPPNGARRPDQVVLHCDADFAQLWLFPRLPAFEAAHPDVRVSIRCTVGLNRPPAEDYACAVVWGRGDWPASRFLPLMTNTVFPVAAPDFFAGLARRPEPRDVTDAMLIHDQTTHWWTAFRAVTASTSYDPRAGRLYNQTALCLEAAARRDGITIGDEVTTGGHLDAGRLTQPFPIRLPSADSYYILTPPQRPIDGPARLLVDWLQAEAERHRQDWRRRWAALDRRFADA